MKYLFLFTFLPLFVLGQDQIETTIIPKPYNPKPYFDQLNKTKLKKVIIISKQKQDNFKDDTTYVYEYNEYGQQVSSLRYENNKITTKTIMKYDKYDNQIEWKIFEPNQTLTTTNFYFNQFNQLDSTKQVSYREKKIIHTSRYAYQYENGKLKFRQIIFNNILNRDDSYDYNDSLLVNYKSILSPDVYFVTNYSYDNYSHLAEINTTHFFNTKSELWNKKNFNYQNGKLISEEELTYDNKKIFAHYYYNLDNKLQKIVSTFAENNRDIEFEYNDFDIKEITVNTNSNSTYLKFYIPLRLENVTFPIVYKEKFTYDKENNLINKKNFVNDDLVKESVYLIEYYK
ncbi:MAG: hypothetical protein ACOVO1_03295 [Chitinophagaceae bacterium]